MGSPRREAAAWLRVEPPDVKSSKVLFRTLQSPLRLNVHPNTRSPLEAIGAAN